MSVANEYNSGVPLVFVDQRFRESEDFKAVFGDNFYEEVNIPPDVENSFVIYSATANVPVLMGGVDEYIMDVSCTLNIVNVRKYGFGQGSELHFIQALKVMRRALCGVCGYDVFYEGEKIGTVDEASYLDEIGLTRYRDGNYDVLQKGISLKLIWR